MKKKFLLMLTIFFLLNIEIKAETKPLEILGAGLSTGTNSPCGEQSGYVACYSPKFQFRVTLIDASGKKVEETNSVDFTYSVDGNTYIHNEKDFKNKGIELINSKNGYYKYKYSDKDSNESDYNAIGSFKYIEVNLLNNVIDYQDEIINYQGKETYKDNHKNYGGFFSDVSNNIKGRLDNVYFEFKNTSEDISSDFISVFLYHAGFTNTQENIDNIKEKFSLIAENNYFLLIEPTFTIYYNTIPNSNKFFYKYGTGTEILEWIKSETSSQSGNYKYNAGYLAGLSADFVYQAGCNLYTIPNIFEMRENEEFVVKNKTICSLSAGNLSRLKAEKLPSRNERLNIMEEVLNESSGYAASTLQLKKFIDTDIFDENVDFNVDLCENDDGILSLKINSPTEGENANKKKYMIKEFLVSGKENAELYCYDEVDYNFEAIMEEFANKNFRTPTTINIPNAVIKVNRWCYFTSNQASEYDATKIESYENLRIKVSDISENNENPIELKKVDTDPTITITPSKNARGERWVNYKFSIEYEYKNDKRNNEYYLSPNKNYTGNGNVSVSVDNINGMFGYSNNMITKLLKIGSFSETIDSTVYTYNIRYLDGDNTSDNLKCDFKYTVDSNGINESLKFRVISLSNPFPARDGTSRLPGTNWLDAKNYVYDYIDNNRAIQYKLGEIKENTREFKENGKADPNDMYTNTEPMYVIDLDASTMKKIREYNKEHTYTDINLTCVNYRQCTSDFLRNSEYIPQDKLTGVCSNKDDYNEVLVNYNGITKERLRNVIYGGGFYQKSYDINKNLRNDTDDLEIFLNKDKNTFFYTCADKSYLSGG